MNSKDNIIYLEDFRITIGKVKSKVFTGRDRGEEVRKASNIDEIYKQYGTVKVIIPSDIFSITPSFLEEFFYNIVTNFGLDEFRKNVIIEPNGYKIEIPLEEGIQRILQRKTAIDK